MNKLIYRWTIYLLDDSFKHNIIWGRDLNSWWAMINNNKFWMKAAKYMMELLMICFMIYTPHEAYKDNVV